MWRSLVLGRANVDWFEWIKLSLSVAGAAGLMAWLTSLHRILRAHGLADEAEKAKKDGFAMFKFLFVASVICGLIGELNKLLGYPFT